MKHINNLNNLHMLKEEKEQIIPIWRHIGLLEGIKEGSINEWRVAKSYNNFAKYALQDNSLSALCVITFPLIRKSLCCRKKRLYRIIQGREIADFFKEHTIKELSNFYNNGNSPLIKTIPSERILFGNLLKIEAISNWTLFDFITKFYKNEEEPLKTVSAVLEDVVDIEKMLCTVCSDYFVELNYKKDKNNGKKKNV